MSLEENFETAKYFYENGFYQQSKESFFNILKKRPLDFDFLQGYTFSLMQLKEYEKAIIAFEILSFLKKEDAYIHFYKGQCYFSLDKIKEGISSLNESLKNNQDEYLKEKIKILIKQNSEKL